MLYRYRPWSVFESEGKERKPVEEISSRYAFFSSPLRLNDPQDSLLGPEFTGGKEDRHRLLNHAFADTKRLMQKQRCQVSGLDENDPEYKDAVALYRRGEKRKKSCVCCFSRDWNNPLLWTFYAQEHHGFCLGYSTSGSLLGVRGQFFTRIRRWTCSTWKTRKPTMTNCHSASQLIGSLRTSGE